MFIQISRNQLVIEAERNEWEQLRRGLHSLGERNRPKEELDFAIMAILDQEKKNEDM